MNRLRQLLGENTQSTASRPDTQTKEHFSELQSNKLLLKNISMINVAVQKHIHRHAWNTQTNHTHICITQTVCMKSQMK